MRRDSRGMTTGEANRNAHKHALCHKRLIEDNESTKCGERDGMASLDDADVTCPACNPELLPFKRNRR